MQYDDLTLIKFTDGELETILTKEIENAALNDRKLQERLKVISLMSNEKIILSQKYGQKLNQKIVLLTRILELKRKILILDT